MRDTFADLLREAGLVSEATQATRGRVPYRNAPRPLPPSMRGPTVMPRAEIDRDTAQRQAFAPPRDQIREAASMAGELVGTEPLARGVMALRGDYTGRPEPGRAAGEFGMAAVNLGLGALGLADDVGALRAAAPRPLRAMPESAPRPTPPPRQIGRASDGSVLPVREPQPMRQSFVGGSDDLREAAGMRLARDPLPPLRTMGQREDWAQGALRRDRGYEFRGPRDSRYGVRFERTANGTEVTLESLTPGTSQYGRRDENIMSMGEARSVYQRALAAIEHDIATTARDRYVVGGLKPQHRRIFRAMAERQMRANGWPGYALEDGPNNTLVLRRAEDAGLAGSNNRPDPFSPRDNVSMFVSPRANPRSPRTPITQLPDGTPVQEISDANARLLPGAYEKLRGVWGEGRGRTVRLGDVLDHPELFAEFPWMRDIRVGGEVNNMARGHVRQGWFTPRGDQINVSFYHQPTRDQILSTLLHEAQHVDQHASGRIPGGRPTAAESAASGGYLAAHARILGEQEAFRTQARRGMSIEDRTATPPEFNPDFIERPPVNYLFGPRKRLNNRPDPHGDGVGADMREPRFFERRGYVNVTTRAQPLPPPASSETGFGALGRGSNNTIAYGMGGIAGLGALAIPATSTAMQALNPIEQAMLEAEAKQRELEAELYALRNGLPSPAYSGALVPPRRRAQQNAPGL